MQLSELININHLAMNIDPSGLGTSDQTSNVWSDDQYFLQNHARSYRCSFCKRGFSNAQALGGHMNIHRKDRAKLKEFSRENLLSLDINKNSTDSEDSPEASQKSLSLESAETKKVVPEDDMLHEGSSSSRERLPLFTEAPSAKSDDYDFEKQIVENSEKAMVHGQIDLELRLGPEPHDGRRKR